MGASPLSADWGLRRRSVARGCDLHRGCKIVESLARSRQKVRLPAPGRDRKMTVRIGIISDIHYASAAEQARGNDYEWRGLPNPFLRFLVRFHRQWVWLRNPLDQNHLLDRFLEQGSSFDYVIANGDYTCDSMNLGVSDDASFESARLCLDKLRSKFPGRFRAIMGDHELGKVSLVGGRGGMRLASWRRATEGLAIEPFWRFEIGDYV